MADITVTGETPQPYPRPRREGLSPLEAGLLYGGAASTVMGPLGLLVGVGAGIVSKRMRDNYLDRIARDSYNTRAEYQGIQDELDSEIKSADPDTQKLLQHAKRIANEGWYRLASGDQEGRKMIEQANEISRGVISADIQQRSQEQAAQKAFQRGLIGTAANAYREEFQKNQSQFEQINTQADRVLKMAADPNFDPNKPFSKAVITDLLTIGVGGLYRDHEDLLGSLPIVGQFLEKGSDWVTGKFEVSREDFNRVAMNMKKANELQSEDTMVRLGEQARQLDAFAKQNGAIPQDYSLGEYVSGGVNELRFTEDAPLPRTTQSTTTKPTTGVIKSQDVRGTDLKSGLQRKLLEFGEWAQKVTPSQQQRRPTN